MRSSVASKSGRKLDGLSSYFRAIGKYPPLTREEEHVLAVRAEDFRERAEILPLFYGLRNFGCVIR